MVLTDSPTPTGHYSQEIKDLAFEVYAVRANRDMRQTLKLLDALPIPKIPESTVYWWRSHYEWDRRIDLESAARQRELIDLHVAGLRVAAPDAVKYLHDVVNDQAEPHPQKIAAARALIQENRSLILAAVSAGLLEAESAPAMHDLESMTTAELVALMEANSASP